MNNDNIEKFKSIMKIISEIKSLKDSKTTISDRNRLDHIVMDFTRLDMYKDK